MLKTRMKKQNSYASKIRDFGNAEGGEIVLDGFRGFEGVSAHIRAGLIPASLTAFNTESNKSVW
jgi:hypothetical protein